MRGISFLNFLKLNSLLTHFVKFLRKLSKIKDDKKREEVDHFHAFDKYSLRELLFILNWFLEL